MEETIIQLTNDQKIAILEKTKELLGPNGENWTKACWWGVKLDAEEVLERLRMFGYDAEDLTEEEIRNIDAAEEGEVRRRSLEEEQPDEANIWCLMGAIEESAYRLEIIDKRAASERLAEPISLRQLVNSKSEWSTWGVIDVNDRAETTWETIRDLLDERLAQLNEE